MYYPETEVVISVQNVTKRFGKTVALDNLNLKVKRGQIHGFLGPNGAGKSTAIRVLLGLLKKDSGEMTIFGKDPWKDAVEIHKHISYIPGDVNLWPNLTGGEIIDLLAKLQGDKNKKRRGQLIDMFDLDVTKKFHTYSKGNRQKVAVISALSTDASLFLMDEPTSGLDPLLERYFQDYILKEVRSAEKTIFLSSHILSEVDKLCDFVTIIKEGKAVLSDSLNKLRRMTHTQIKVELEEELNLEELKAIVGGVEVKKSGSEYQFKVDTKELDRVIKFLSQKKVISLHSSPPTLEELFISHYSDE